MENAKKFFEEIIKTEEAKELFASFEKPENVDDAIKIYAEVAEKLGIEISADEITEYLSKEMASGEIDDEELSQLTGGGDHADCKDTYKDGENCWWDDACDIVNTKYDNYVCKHTNKKVYLNCSKLDDVGDIGDICGQVARYKALPL